jgi:DNA-binding GntR family transcriptional regulator
MAYEFLKRGILGGHYHPGQTLIEESVATELGTSRTPVREAIRELSREGLVELIPNKGAQVRILSAQDLLEIFDIKIRVEGLCAANAARKSGPAIASKLFEATLAMETAARSSDRKAYLSADEKFHELIYEGAKSEHAYHIVSELNALWHRMRQGMAAIGCRMKTSVEEHRRIAKAIESHDAEGAEAAMRDHLEQLRDQVRMLLEDYSVPISRYE